MSKRLLIDLDLPDDIMEAIDHECSITQVAVSEYIADCIVSWTLIGLARQAPLEIPPLTAPTGALNAEPGMIGASDANTTTNPSVTADGNFAPPQWDD